MCLATDPTLIFPEGALGLGRILKNGGKELITSVVMGSAQAHSQFSVKRRWFRYCAKVEGEKKPTPTTKKNHSIPQGIKSLHARLYLE